MEVRGLGIYLNTQGAVGLVSRVAEKQPLAVLAKAMLEREQEWGLTGGVKRVNMFDCKQSGLAGGIGRENPIRFRERTTG